MLGVFVCVLLSVVILFMLMLIEFVVCVDDEDEEFVEFEVNMKCVMETNSGE